MQNLELKHDSHDQHCKTNSVYIHASAIVQQVVRVSVCKGRQTGCRYIGRYSPSDTGELNSSNDHERTCWIHKGLI